MNAKHDNPGNPTMSPAAIDACFDRMASRSGPLDGQAFEALATDAGKKEPEPLHLLFRQGALLAVECMPHGFGAGPYVASTAGDGAIAFTSEIRSLDHETENHLWKGRIKNGVITGSMVWTDQEGKQTELNYEGKAMGPVE